MEAWDFSWGRTMLTAPDREGARAWLFCLDPTGWHSGILIRGRWWDSATMTRELHPIAWEAVFPEPKL